MWHPREALTEKEFPMQMKLAGAVSLAALAAALPVRA